MYSLGELADVLGLQFSGDAQLRLKRLASLAEAKPNELAFLSRKKYLPQLAQTKAGAVILRADQVEFCPSNCLISDNPYVTFAKLSQLFDTSPVAARGVHSSASVSPDAVLAEDVSVGPNAVIEAGAELGAGVVVGANTYIGHGSRLGAGTRIYPGVVIYHDVFLGEACTVHAQTVLGSDGFGYAPGPQGWEKICQAGGVRIGDRVEIGSCTTIDRGALDHTELADGVIIDNQVHIAHNCYIGKNTAIAGCCGLAGSTIIGANCTLGGCVGVAGQLEICDDVHFTGMTMVTKSITEPGNYSSGTPMQVSSSWRRNAVRFSSLDAMHKRLVGLENKLKS